MKKKIFLFLLKLLNGFQLRRISKFFKKKNLKIIFDIGAYKGEFIDIFVNDHKNANFFSFEPMSENFFYLKEKFRNRDNIYLINKGVSDNNLQLDLNINDTSNVSTFSDFNESVFFYKLRRLLLGKKKFITKTEKCEVVTLDQFTEQNNIDYIDLMKLDIEGFELKALKGGKNILKKTKYVCVEITFSNIFKNYDYKEVDNFLQQVGFKVEKNYLFPVMNFEDRIYKNLNITHS